MRKKMQWLRLLSVLLLAGWTGQAYADADAQHHQGAGRPECNEGHARRGLSKTPRGGIDRIVFGPPTVAFSGQSFGDVGVYELLTGTAYGTIDPESPLNHHLVLLKKAPRNADGLVPYSMDVGLLRPQDPSKRDKIVYEVVNRGGAPGIFGRLNGVALPAAGNGFLMIHGYEVVWSGWQPELDPLKTTKAYFPVALNRSEPILEKVMEVYIPDTPMTGQRTGAHFVSGNTLNSAMIYAPSSLDPALAEAGLTVREHFADARVPLAQSSVKFIDDHTVQIDMTAAMAMGFDLGAIYELVYVAKNPYVGGVGFAATRDLISFLRYGTMDNAGNPNPAGPHVKAAYAQGNSQSGRFQRDFVYQGFNEDLCARMVFDGIFPTVPGSRRTDHNTVFSQSSRWVRQHEEQNYASNDFPFAYSTSTDVFTDKTDGVLRKCLKSSTCPMILHLDTDFEAWHGGCSLNTTDTFGHPLRIPPNVRLYQISGSQHGTGNGTPTALPICKWQSNPIDYGRMYRALTVAMEEWVTQGKEPPASAYPSLANGTLQTLEQMAAAYPTIPGQPFSQLVTPATLWDFQVVPPEALATYPILVPKIDAYGNPYGGVIMPDLAAPLGTYSGRNYRTVGHGTPDLCGAVNTGSFIPFAKTRAERLASGDSRPSLEELYPGGETDFRAKRRAQVQKLIDGRYILPEELESFTAEVAFPK
jgi:hypothetical protein